MTLRGEENRRGGEMNDDERALDAIADDVAWKGEERRSQYNYHDKYLPPHRTAQRSTDESIRAMKGKQNAGEKK